MEDRNLPAIAQWDTAKLFNYSLHIWEYTVALSSRQVSSFQACRGVLIKSCSENIQQTYRRTPIPKCDFSKVAKQL